MPRSPCVSAGTTCNLNITVGSYDSGARVAPILLSSEVGIRTIPHHWPVEHMGIPPRLIGMGWPNFHIQILGRESCGHGDGVGNFARAYRKRCCGCRRDNTARSSAGQVCRRGAQRGADGRYSAAPCQMNPMSSSTVSEMTDSMASRYM